MACFHANITSQDNCSCLSATLSRIGEGLSVNVANLSGGLVATIGSLSERLIATAVKTSSELVAQVANMGDGLSVRCSIICTLDKIADFIDVTPAEIQWITDDMGVFFDVESNVEWIIVTS